MEIQALCEQQIREIYAAHMQRDFAPDELKPLESILRQIRRGLYKGWGLFQEGELIAYAMFMTAPGGRVALLDYYAVLPALRSGGYGSRFLALLRQKLTAYDGIVLESEHPEYAVGRRDKAIRTRRIAFYRRGGVRPTSLTSRLFDVTYAVMYLPCGRDIPDGQLFRELDSIYRQLFPHAVWQRRVELSMRLAK